LIQLVFAFLIITAVLFILGTIAGAQGGLAVLGVRGTGAAVLFLVLSFGSLALIFVAYLVLKRAMRQNETLDRSLLRVPALWPCAGAGELRPRPAVDPRQRSAGRQGGAPQPAGDRQRGLRGARRRGACGHQEG